MLSLQLGLFRAAFRRWARVAALGLLALGFGASLTQAWAQSARLAVGVSLRRVDTAPALTAPRVTRAASVPTTGSRAAIMIPHPQRRHQARWHAQRGASQTIGTVAHSPQEKDRVIVAPETLTLLDTGGRPVPVQVHWRALPAHTPGTHGYQYARLTLTTAAPGFRPRQQDVTLPLTVAYY